MKVNEIISEAGIWQGVKNIGRGLGQVVGGAATGVVYGLDRLAGGSGDVGTASQRLARKAAIDKRLEAASNKDIPKQALAYFASEMNQQDINIDDPTTFNPQAVRQSLKDFALRFFVGGETDKQIQAYIAQSLQFEPLPNAINSKTLTNYFAEVNKIRANAILWVAQNQNQNQGQGQGGGQQPAQLVSAGGVTLKRLPGRNAAGQPTPTYVEYKNYDFALMDNGDWLDMAGNPVSPVLASFLQTELESITP